jgi:hypothetical protein
VNIEPRECALSVIVELDTDVLSWFDRKSEKIALYLEPVACFRHQLLSIWASCLRVPFLGLLMVMEYPCGRADRAEPIVTEGVTIEMMIRFQRERLETGNILFHSDRDADVHHTSELIQEPQEIGRCLISLSDRFHRQHLGHARIIECGF